MVQGIQPGRRQANQVLAQVFGHGAGALAVEFKVQHLLVVLQFTQPVGGVVQLGVGVGGVVAQAQHQMKLAFAPFWRQALQQGAGQCQVDVAVVQKKHRRQLQPLERRLPEFFDIVGVAQAGVIQVALAAGQRQRQRGFAAAGQATDHQHAVLAEYFGK